MKGFYKHSYGFRRGRGTHDALKRIITLLDRCYLYIVDADIKACFDSIPHYPLMELVSQKVKDQRVLNLIKLYLTNGVMEGGEYWYPEEGTPQGAVISPLLANIFLNPLDHLVAEAGHEMVRYADDFVIPCRSRTEAELALVLVEKWMTKANLTLHPDKTSIRHGHRDGFNFLGYRFQGNLRSPRPENITRLKDRIKKAVRENGTADLNKAIPKINQTMKDWLPYFRLCNDLQPFQDIDHWVWQCLTATQEKITRKNKRRHPKPLKRAPYSLTHALQKG